MNIKLTKLSKSVIYFLIFGVLTILLIMVPEILREEAVGKSNPPAKWPVYVIVWVYALPVFFALNQTLKLISLIEIKKAFSLNVIAVLNKIKFSAITFALMVLVGATIGVITGKRIDPSEDYAPVVGFGIVLIFVSSVITAFIATLQKLLQNAIDIKSENDLTV